MSTPNPLVPQGTFPEKNKSHIRVAVFAILAIHVVLLGALLIAGCKKTEPSPGDSTTNVFTPPPLDLPPLAPPPSYPPPATNVYVPPVPPPIPPPTPPEPPASLTEHTVVKGDNFYTLGKKYNVGWKTIAEANPGVDSTKLKLGQKLKIPPPKSGGPAPVGLNGGVNPGAPGGGEKTYTVKSRDTLGKIAKDHGVSLKALRAANHLKTDRINVGQKLIIPAKAAPATPDTGATPPVPPPFTPSPTPPGITNL